MRGRAIAPLLAATIAPVACTAGGGSGAHGRPVALSGWV
jgi:hypothetical protein